MSDSVLALNFETLGQDSAPAIVLIHGLFGDLDNLKSISRALSDSYYVINVDLRNHGQSPWADSMSFSAMAKDVLAVLDTLNIEQAHLLGHSLGGKVAMEIALNFPTRVRSLIVADIAPVSYEPSHNTILDALESIDFAQVDSRQAADTLLAESISELSVRQFLLKNLNKTEYGWAWRMNLVALRHCYLNLIGSPSSELVYKGPVLFIRGGRSDYIQAKHKDAIITRFPQAQSKTINDVGHWLHAEKPTVFNSLVQRFLDEN